MRFQSLFSAVTFVTSCTSFESNTRHFIYIVIALNHSELFRVLFIPVILFHVIMNNFYLRLPILGHGEMTAKWTNTTSWMFHRVMMLQFLLPGKGVVTVGTLESVSSFMEDLTVNV